MVKDKAGWKATLVQLEPSLQAGGRAEGGSGGRTYQGWVSPTYLQKEPAPVVVSPPRPKPLLTVVVPGTDKPKVSCSGGKVSLETSEGR